MKAILLKEHGDASQLYLGEYPKPEPAEREIRVKVKATALNRADILQRRGFYPPPPGASTILGLEFSGIVEKPGPKCTKWQSGDRVCGLVAGGGYAEYATIHEDMAIPIPENLGFEEAAAIPEVFLTAFKALFLIGGLQEKQTVLIHAGASGVGTAAIQLAREIGAKAIVTAGSQEKIIACLELGAMAGFNYREGEFAAKVLETTNGNGANLIVDFVGASYLAQNITCLAPDGCMVILSLLGGWQADNLDLRAVLIKRLRIVGSSLRGRSLAYKIKLTEALAQFALPKFADGSLKPVIDCVFPWEQVSEAHLYMEANKNIGKIVLNGM
jgi:putative PIG3 family NAD(P)H quinone oxidoreductase